jgi:hypothetical protein
MEVEFENDDSGDNISYGDAESLYCTGSVPAMVQVHKKFLTRSSRNGQDKGTPFLFINSKDAIQC